MMKREAGFTLIELMITMVVFVLVMAAASQIFTGLLTQFKQQSKIAETNIEGVIGLEMMRQDVAQAGYGLPWIIPAGITYSESSVNPFSLNDATSGFPKGLVSSNNVTYTGTNSDLSGSDYLVVRATNVAVNDASQKWTTLKMASAADNPRQWSPAADNLASTDRVIVISPGNNDLNARRLVVSGTSFYTAFNSVLSSPWPPADLSETRLVYGINISSDPVPVRPFNRADYLITHVDAAGNSITPGKCAPHTGVLVKATMNHDANGTFTYLPLLDCVADMQIAYALDNDEDGDFEDGVGGDAYSDDITGLTAVQIRTRVKEVRVYVLAHEGQRDASLAYPTATIDVPGTGDPAAGLGRTFNLSTTIGNPEYKHYRWKIYTMVVKPLDLRGI